MSTIVACMIDAGGNASPSREALGAPHQAEELNARFESVLANAEKELPTKFETDASIIVCLSGLKIGAPCVDLFQAAETIRDGILASPPLRAETLLLDGISTNASKINEQSGDVKLVINSIRSEFTDMEFRLLVGHLSRHPHLSAQMTKSIHRTVKAMEVLRNLLAVVNTGLFVYYGRRVSQWIVGPSFSYPGLAFIALAIVQTVLCLVLMKGSKRLCISHMQAIHLAWSAYDDWTFDMTELQPRPITESIHALQQLIVAAQPGNSASLHELGRRSVVRKRMGTAAQDSHEHQELDAYPAGTEQMVDLLAGPSCVFQKRKLVLFSGSRQCEVFKQLPITGKLKEAGVVVEVCDDGRKA
jgi:hypothetical protein